MHTAKLQIRVAGNCRNSCSGFTLVELMAAAVAASILAITAGTMLFQAYNSWTSNHNAINLHRDGSYAINLITRAVRNGSSSNIVRAVNNNLILSNVKMNNSAAPATVRFYRRRTDLIYDPDTSKSGDENTLIKNGIKFFGVYTNTAPGTIRVRMRIQHDEESLILDSISAFRN